MTVGADCYAGLRTGDRWEEEWRPSTQEGELGEAAGCRALDVPGPHGSEEQGRGLKSCLDIQQGHPLVLVATLPAMDHL